MAKCLITAVDVDDIRASVGKPGATEAVTFSTSTQSSAFTTNCIRVIADADVNLAFGASPTADADDLRVPADTVEYFLVDQGFKVACYDGTS